MSKQLTFGKGGGKGGEVDRNERLVRPISVAVDGPRGKFFSRSAFAVDQDAGVGSGRKRDSPKNFLDFRATAYDVTQLPFLVV